MKIKERNKRLLEKLQGLSEKKKKIIIWVIVILLGLIMGGFWITGAIDSISKGPSQPSNINFPKFDLPEFQIPDIDTDSIENNTTPSN